MIGASLQHDSRARSSTELLLALFLGFALSVHGLYYPKEWLLFSFLLSVFIMAIHLPKKLNGSRYVYTTIGMTDCLLLGMILVSLLGILKPVRLTDGFLEALKWGIFWVFYRLGVSISFHETARINLMRYMKWLAVTVAVIGWLPWISKVGGRLSSVFGYPNAAAALFGAVLLLYPKKKMVQILLGISLLGTGSRAGVGLYLIVLAGQYFFLGVNKQRLRSQYIKGFLSFLIGIIGATILFSHYPLAWDNLTDWGFSSSSWQERFVYFKDGLKLAWESWGLPQAGGWRAFPTVQSYPYWTTDPHSSIIHILLNQGIIGIIGIGVWSVYTLLQERKIWRRHGYLKTSEEIQTRLRLNSALLYLALHSLVDADFSFGSLGIFFWLLYGCMVKSQKFRYRLSAMDKFGLGAILCLLCGYMLLNPELLNQEQAWNKQAVQRLKSNPGESEKLWLRSLKWDQTQDGTKRELAEHLLRKGDLDAGFNAVLDALRWQAFELGAYEWAQSVILEAAEENRQKSPQKAVELYHWVDEVPEVIKMRRANLTPLQQKLWSGHTDFVPSQHILLLAEYARQRQLTQRLP